MTTTEYALAAACDELEEAGACATAEKRNPGVWHVTISGGQLDFTMPAMEGGDFAAATAGFRLIEHGWMTRPCAHFAGDRAAGWRLREDGTWTAPVARSPEGDPQ